MCVCCLNDLVPFWLHLPFIMVELQLLVAVTCATAIVCMCEFEIKESDSISTTSFIVVRLLQFVPRFDCFPILSYA